MTPIVFDRDAKDELREALARFEKRRHGLGGEFRAEFEAALARIRENPQGYPISDENDQTRFCMVHRFPYTIYYVELGNQIWVAAVAHQHRRPGYWTRRRPE